MVKSFYSTKKGFFYYMLYTVTIKEPFLVLHRTLLKTKVIYKSPLKNPIQHITYRTIYIINFEEPFSMERTVWACKRFYKELKVLNRTISCLNGSLHGKMVLLKTVLHSTSPERALLLQDWHRNGRRTLPGATQSHFQKRFHVEPYTTHCKSIVKNHFTK